MAKKKGKDKDAAAGPVKRHDAYTMLLFITFACLVAGCVLMNLDFDEYASKPAEKEKVPALPRLGTIPPFTPAAAPVEEKKEEEKKEPEKKDDEKKDTKDEKKDGEKKEPEKKEGAAGFRDAAFEPVAIAATRGPVAFAARAPLPPPRPAPADVTAFAALPGFAPLGE